MLETLASFGHTLLSFILILSIIVFIHEFGHYIIARLCGVKIETFSIGFGREIFGWTDRAQTRWKFSLLPLGGYVKMYGDQTPASTPDNDKLEKMSEQEKQVSFYYKPLWKKSLIVFGGPLFNFLTTIAIFTYFVFTNGITSTEPVVGEVLPDSAALEAGLQAGDRITAVNDDPVEIFHDIPMAIVTNLGTEITIHIQREGEVRQVQLTPRIVEDVDAFGNTVEKPLIGIRSQELSYRDVGFFGAVEEAVKRTWHMCVSTLEVIGQLITVQRGPEQLKGPIGIAQMSGQAADAGTQSVLWFIALLSANLGLINLLPIPMLDGGHLLFYAIEAGRGGRPLAQKIQEFSFRIGFAMLATLMAFTIINDLVNL